MVSMVPMLCATIWRRPTFGLAIRPVEHLLQGVARPHRAFAIVAVVEQLRPRRPGEHHGVAAEPDAVRQARGIERRGLEGLVEAVDVDEHVAAAGGRREQVADLRDRLDRVERQSASPTAASENRLVVGRREPGARDAQRGRPFGPEPGPGAGAVRPACAWWRPAASGWTTARTRRSGRGRRHAGAARKRQRRRRRRQPAQHGAPRRGAAG